MSEESSYGSDWNLQEIEAVVSAYSEMLTKELAGEPYTKASYNRALQAAIGRTRGSIDFKLENISAVMQRLGLPWIKGYKPFANFQGLLLDTIEKRLSNGTLLAFALAREDSAAPLEGMKLHFESAPASESEWAVSDERIERLLRKFDPAERDGRNRLLGRKGEELVLQHERERLSTARPELAEKIEWTSDKHGDGAGYDIHSFELDGRDRLIEVKTTTGYERTPFFLSANELDLSLERPREFRLVRVFNFAKTPKAFELLPPLAQHISLSPQNYRARIL